MAEIDPLTFRLIADMKAAQASISNLERTSDRSFSKLERDILRVEAQMKRSSGAIGASLKGLAASLGAYFSGRELVGMIDSFTRLQNNLRVAGQEGEGLARVQQNLLDISSRYGVSVETLSNVFLKASLAQKELGASTSQIIQLNEIVAASLKITGTSAAEARGALLQLGQALGSDVVRGEEFNSLLENALPLVQAAARGIDRFGGSVAQLRKAVVDGKVSSQEFFQGILKGGVQTLADAEKATLTLSGAFEALTSRLTVYVGQSAQANGATAALAGGLQLLADNLDTVINVLAIIASFMGTRMVAATVAGSRAWLAFTAVLAGTRTASAVATAGIGALTAALTGPAGVALAITAVVGGLYYLSTQSEDTAASIKKLEDSNEEASRELDRMIGRLKAAGVNTDGLGEAAERAAVKVDRLTDAYTRMLIEARKFNQGTLAGDILDQSKIITESQARQEVLRKRLAGQRATKDLGPGLGGATAAQIEATKAELEEEIRKERLARDRIEVTTRANEAGVDLSDKPATTPRTTSPKSNKGGPKGEDPKDREFRNEQDLRALQLEELRAKEQAATSATKRAEYAREALALEGLIRRKDIDEAERKGELNSQDAIARRKIIDNLYGAADEIVVQGRETAYQLAITREEQERLARQQADAMRDELDALGAEAGNTDVRRARVEIERRMLEIQQEIERRLLDEAIARGDVADAAAARAALARKQAADRTGFDRDSQGPLGQYLDEVRRIGLNMDDEFEKIAVGGLRTLNDGLTDAIMGAESLGDVFKNVAKQIIADLIRIAIQQTIVNSLMGGIGGLFGGTSQPSYLAVGGGIGSGLPGRASGGYVAPGQTVRVNEHRGGAEYLRMGSQGGTVIPLGQVNAMAARGGQSGVVEIRVYGEEGGTFVPRVEAISADVSLKITQATASAIVDRAANETMRRASRPRMPGAGR